MPSQNLMLAFGAMAILALALIAAVKSGIGALLSRLGFKEVPDEDQKP